MAELKQLSKQLIESDNETQQYKSICTDLKYKLETAEALLDEGDAEIQGLNAVSELLDKKVIDLQALLRNADDAVTHLKGEIESLAIEKESMANLMQSEIDALRERGRYLISQMKITEELPDCSRNELQTKLAKSQDDAIQSKALVADLRFKLESADNSLVEANVTVQSLLQDCSCWEKQANDLGVSLANANEANTKKNDEAESLTVELSDLRRQNDSLTDNLTSKEAEILMLNDRMRELFNQLDALSNLKGEYESLAIEKESMERLLKSEIDVLRERERVLIGQMELNNDQYDSKIAESQYDVIQSKALVADLRFKLESADNSRVEAEEETMAAELRPSNYMQIMTSVEDGHKLEQAWKASRLEMDIAKLNLSLKMKEVENASLLSQLREWKITFDDLTTGLRQAEAQCQSNTENHELKQDELILRNNDLTTSVENLSAHVQHIEAKLRRDKLSHEVTQGKLLKDIRDLQNVVAGNNIKCIHLANELEAENSEYLKSVREKDLELETMTLAIESKEDEICRLKNVVSSANQSIYLLQFEGNATVGALVTELNNARKSLDEERESLNDRIKTLQRELNESVDALQQQKEWISKNESMHASDLESWHIKLSEANEREHDVREQANELKRLLNARQVEIDRLVDELHSATSDHEESVSATVTAHRLNIERMNCAHDNKRHELEQRMFEFSGKLRQRQVEVDQLQQKLQERMELYSSLREYSDEKERKVLELLAEIELLERKRNLIAQSMSKVESEKQRLNDELNIKEAAIEVQNLAMIKVVEEFNQSEMRFQSKLEATRSALVQISMDLADTREVAAKAIEDSKNDAKQVVQRVVNTFKASHSKSESAIRKLLQAKKRVHEELLTKDEEIKALATMRSVIVSENAEMKHTIQQQEELLSQLNHNHQHQLSKLNEKLRIATINWAHEKSSHESKMQSFEDVINEKCLLNRSLLARVEVASILAQRDDKFGKMFDAVGMMKDACDNYCAVDFSQDSEMDELRITSVSREKLIKMISVDLTLAQDEIVSLKAEVECAKATSQCKIMSLREEFSEKLSALIDDMTKGRASIESDWRSFQNALRQVAVCIAHEDQALPIEALPEMTALLTTFFELFQQKVDQISSLQSQLKKIIMNGNHLNETSDPFSGCRNDLAVHDLMSEIKVANQMMDEMSRKSDSETRYRKMTEIKCKAGETALLDAKERITTLEHQIREMEERALVQSTKIKDLDTYIDVTRHQFNEINANLQSKSKEAKDIEMHLEHAESQKRKLELQYERSLAEIESSKKHSVDLTTMIIEKVSLLEFRFA
jgi:chromosome segregation ATPase